MIWLAPKDRHVRRAQLATVRARVARHAWRDDARDIRAEYGARVRG